MYLLLGPFHLIGASADLIKDSVFLYTTATALGGIGIIFADPTIFSSTVGLTSYGI